MGNEKEKHYPGVYERAIPGKDKDKAYYISYRTKIDGKQHHELAGFRIADKMTAAKASRKRYDKIHGTERTKRGKGEDKLTIQKLWEAYDKVNPDRPGAATDKSRYEKYLKAIVGDREIGEVPRFIDKIKSGDVVNRKPQTQKHVLALLRVLVNYGVKKKGIAPVNIEWSMPRVDNARSDYRS